MDLTSTVTVEMRGRVFGSERERVKKTWFGISMGVCIGVIITLLLEISLPGWIAGSACFAAGLMYLISAIRCDLQKHAVNIVECEPGEQAALIFDKKNNGVFLGLTSDDGEIVHVLLFRKYTCRKQMSENRVVFRLEGKPSRAIESTCQYALTGDLFFCLFVNKVRVEYVILDDERPQIVAALESLAEKGVQRIQSDGMFLKKEGDLYVDR